MQFNKSRRTVQICRHFQSKGRCRYGSRCRFSHDRHANTRPEKRLANTTNDDAYFWQKFTRDTSRPFFSLDEMERFVKSALTYVESTNTADNIIEALGNSFGNQRLEDIVTINLIPQTHHSTLSCCEKVIFPLLGLLTNYLVKNSLLHNQIQMIYRVVERNLGTTFVKMALPSLSASVNTCISKYTVGNGFKGVFEMIYLLLCRDRKTAYHFVEEFRGILNEMTRLIDLLSAPLQSQKEMPQNYCNELVQLNGYLTKAEGIISDAEIHLGITEKINECKAKPKTFFQDLKKILAFSITPPGGRHDNDFADFTKIRIAPTGDEIYSTQPDYLPTLSAAVNEDDFLAAGSTKLLDRQFRLFREDMLAPIRNGIQYFSEQMKTADSKSRKRIIDTINRTGRFSVKQKDTDCSLNIFQGGEVDEFTIEKRNGLVFQLKFKCPLNIKNRLGTTPKSHQSYWEKTKNFMRNNLVCLMYSISPDKSDQSNEGKNPFHLLFAIITSRDPHHMSQDMGSTIQLGISPIDKNEVPSFFLFMSKRYQKESSIYSTKNQLLLLETPGIFYEAYRPILKALQETIPHSMPFIRYVAPTLEKAEQSRGTPIDFPGYVFDNANFEYNLTAICKNDDNANEPLQFSPRNRNDQFVLGELERRCILDKGQREALLKALSHEIAIIEGPPGTGKTKLGVDIVRVLLSTKAKAKCITGPILCICYTNHALDQFLNHLLDVGFKKIARMGGNSKDERMKKLQVREMCYDHEVSRSKKYMQAMLYEKLNKIELNVSHIVKKIQRKQHKWSYMEEFLSSNYVFHYKQFKERLDSGFRAKGDVYSNWCFANDLKIIEEYAKFQEKLKKNISRSLRSSGRDDMNLYTFLIESEDKSSEKCTSNKDGDLPSGNAKVPQTIPSSNRDVSNLVDENICGDLWSMSKEERWKLNNFGWMK